MPLTAFVGSEYGFNMGNLKTYSMTLFTKLDSEQNRKIVTNYTLKGIPYKKVMTINDLLDEVIDNPDVTISLDEFHTIWDCYSRPSTRDGTAQFKTFIRQVRKRKTKLNITAQSIFDIPLTMRKMIQYIYQVRKLHTDYTECCLDDCYREHIQELTPIFLSGSNYMLGDRKYYPVIPEIFNMYDTDELIGLCDNIF